MDAETAEKNRRYYPYFLKAVSIIGLVFIGYTLYLFYNEGIHKRDLLMFQIALVLTGIGYVLVEPMKSMFQSYIDMINNKGWMNNLSNPETLLKLGKQFIVLSQLLFIVPISAFILGLFIPFMALIFIVFFGLGFHTYISTKKAMKGPIIFTCYYRIQFDEAVNLLREQILPHLPDSNFMIKRKKITIKSREEKIIGRASAGNCFILQVITPNGDISRNRRLRNTVSAVLEGRPLPEAAASAAPEAMAGQTARRPRRQPRRRPPRAMRRQRRRAINGPGGRWWRCVRLNR